MNYGPGEALTFAIAACFPSGLSGDRLIAAIFSALVVGTL